MPKIRIDYDKEGCIGAMACVAIDPKRWKDNGENKADLINGKKNENDIYTLEGDFSNEEVDAIVESAEVCPVAVIGVTNLDTGIVLFKREKQN